VNIQQAISANSLKLGLFAIVTASILAFTNLHTKDRIEEEIRKAEEKALLEIIPDERHDNSMLDDIVLIPEDLRKELNLRKKFEAHVARIKGEPVAIILPGRAPDGYSGPIEIIIGINMDGTIAGVRVTRHKETPGLGDGISLAKSDWILGFDGKSLKDPEPEKWKVKKDKGIFDQFTGATITPRAVVKQVYQSLVFFDKHAKELLDTPDQLDSEQGE
jgi:electron transport complex protein RnfG